MCAMDRSGDDRVSQSVKDVLLHIKELYHSSPVSVCVRNSEREFLYGRCEQVPDMRSSYSSGAHPRGTS
ncbi:hypothetical protein FOT95_17225 [Klebsiella michiganensis]|nr:hypothetical protein [Klebsiella michiganensis]MBE0243205.1 hypothetical protein [Klebsiella michiganensis]MBE0260815.1 hypothetical protein [Klebsiella michiganensis]